MRLINLRSAGGELELGDVTGVKAGMRVRGTGMPPVALQWFEGAGEGASFRGGRALARVMDMPIRIYGRNEAEVRERMTLVSRIFVLDNAPVRITMTMDDEAWYADFVRSGGGDWTWGEDTDGKTYVAMVMTLQAGDPYWTRERAESRRITSGGVGFGLLGPGQSLVQLRLSNTEGLGAVKFQNSGDVDAWPVWTIAAPFTAFTLKRGARSLTWTGTKNTGFIRLDTRYGTVVDETGADRYTGLGPIPKFWTIPQGDTDAEVTIAAATADTEAAVTWYPRKAMIF